MEKKKLTDEEIAKGLENWILHDCTAKHEDLVNALNLIHRLQDENERLTEEKKTLVWLNQDLKNKLEQVGKDMAKEVLQMADKINKGGQNDLCELEVAIKKRYGVEVEW